LPTKIKICGITNQPDAGLAADLGADLLGFNFYPPSPRYLEPDRAAQIIAALPARRPEIVGLFVNAAPAHIAAVLQSCPLTMLQLHGDESPDLCRTLAALGLPLIKALRMRSPADLDRARDYDTPYILLDAFHPDLYGGTGDTFDWSWIASLPDKKILLAGGITPANVQQALAVRPYALDLCSGVEAAPGRKDPQKLRDLFAHLRTENTDHNNQSNPDTRL